MIQHNRRALLAALSTLWLPACGGGDASDADLTESSAGIPRPGTRPGDPAPAPAPAPEPAPGLAPSPTPTPVPTGDEPAQFLTWDAGSGPTREYWSRHLQLPWRNRGTGDWLDATQQPQGSAAYASITVQSAGRAYEFDITPLVQRWVASGENRGAMLRTARSAVTWSGRLGTTPPVLHVVTSNGTVDCPCLAFAGFSPSASGGLDTRTRVKTSSAVSNIVQFDLSGIEGSVQSATMRLHCEDKLSTPCTVSVYEADPPRFQFATGGAKPAMGVAAAYPGDVGLRNDPSVIRAGDFSDLGYGKVFDLAKLTEANPYEFLPDPDAPGTIMFRGSFTPAANGSSSFKVETMRADYTDPLRPPAVVEEESSAASTSSWRTTGTPPATRTRWPSAGTCAWAGGTTPARATGRPPGATAEPPARA